MALPTNQPIAPERNKGELMRVTNQEQPFHPIYNYALVTDAREGLILVDVNTLADGEPRNNFLKRAATWNEGGILKGARHLAIGGRYVYVAADAGIVVLDLDDPLKPRRVAVVPLKGARASALQFRYLFAVDEEGLHVIDVTVPEKARRVEGASVRLADARRVYVARTYAYVAGGREGLVIVDVEKPASPRVYARFDDGGRLNDARDVVVASTNASAFAYVADGANGLKVLQLTSPEIQPKFYGFSPEPKPRVIARRETRSPAISLAKGLDRDRGVDETGGQIAVFGRIGSRPFTREEQQRFYLGPDGGVWTVSDTGEPGDFRDARPPANTRKAEAR